MTKPPVTGATHTLPFDQLSPLDFERLCLALLPREGFTDPRHLGAAGGERGRDIVARRDGALWYVQCKRVKECGPQVLLAEVKKIEDLIAERPDLRPTGLLFMVSCDVSDTAEDRAAGACKALGLACEVWARTDLDWRVQEHPDLVERFFQMGVPPAPPEDLFTVPFIRNPDFVGRQEDLERLHEALHDETPVGIRPAGLTGMGGIGKTQLAVEYAYRYRDSYPGGVLWINAAEPLARGFAALGWRLRPDTADRSQEKQGRAAGSYLRDHADALLVFDNLADPAALNRQVAGGLIPAALPCRVLFTTRRRDLGHFTPVEVTVLPEDPALHLLLRHPDRQSALAPAHPEHNQARAICRLLGWLPLALEVAGAFLGEWPDQPLADFRARLRQEGVLATLDEEAEELPAASLPLIHDAAVAATLQTQWDALADEDACLLLRVAGQLPEAAQIPVARLGLLAGVPDDGRPGRPSRLARSLKRLERASLVEELQETQIRLHPLVREFAARQTPGDETPAFRAWCAANLANAYDRFALLQDQCARRGIDALQGDLLAALDLLPTKLQDSMEDTRDRLQGILRLLQREAHNLRGWVPEQHPGFFARQVQVRANSLNLANLATGAAAHLMERTVPFLAQRWRASSESPALERTLTGHEEGVNAVAVTPDGRRAVSASDDGTLRAWDLANGQELAKLCGHHGGVVSVVVMPDGRRAVSASRDRSLRVWDLESGVELAVLLGHEGVVFAVAATPDGRRVVSASSDGTLRVWDISGFLDTGLETGGRVAALLAHEESVNSIKVTPDGRRVVSISDYGTLRVWDLASGQELAARRGHEELVLAVALTPDGWRAVSSSDDRTLRVWDLAAGEELAVLRGHESSVLSVALTPDGRRAVSASEDRTVRLWDLISGQELAALRGHEDWVRAVAVTPDGRRAVSASEDRTLRVWNIDSSFDTGQEAGEEWSRVQHHESRVFAVAVTPDGRRAVSASEDRTLRVWDLATGEALARPLGHKGSVNSVAVTPDGRRAVSASDDRTLRVWNLATGEEQATLRGHKGSVNSVAVAPDGRRAVSASDDRTLRVWDLATGEEQATLRGHKGSVNSVAVTPDGRRAVSASYDRTLRVWDLATGEALAVLRGHESSVLAVAVTPDGRRAVSASSDGTLRVWDLTNGEDLAVLRGHEHSVFGLAVTPDGRRAISASADWTLVVWDLASGEEFARLRGHEDWVLSVAVTPDGRRAVSASDDRTLRVWDVDGGAEVAAIALDGVPHIVAVAPDGVTIMTVDGVGNVYCFRYVEPPELE